MDEELKHNQIISYEKNRSLVSGGGTNLQRIIDSIESGEIPNTEITLVVADRECYGLTRSRETRYPSPHHQAQGKILC